MGFLLLLPAASGKVAFDWMKCKVTNHSFHLIFRWKGVLLKIGLCVFVLVVFCVVPADPQSA